MTSHRHKYGIASKAARTVDGIVFASKAEAIRYVELKALIQAGELIEVHRQPRYQLGDVKYVADFQVTDRWNRTHAEDVKGVETARRLVAALKPFQTI